MIKLSQLCATYSDVFKFLDTADNRYKHLPLKYRSEITLVDMSVGGEFIIAYEVTITISNATSL